MLRGAALIPVIVLLGRVVNSFNVDHRSPYIMTADSTTANGDSYFGFSIIQHSFGQDYKILVGAPRDSYSTGNQTGGVYLCTKSHEGVCIRQSNFDSLTDIFLESNHSYFGSIVPGLPFASKNQAQDGQMLGYSMFESEGKLGTCAPRYKHNPEQVAGVDGSNIWGLSGLGRCLVFNDDYSDTSIPVFQWKRGEFGEPAGEDVWLAGIDAEFVQQDGNKMLVIGQIFNDFSPSAPSSPFGTLTAQQPIANHSAQLKANPAGTGYDGYLGYKIKKGQYFAGNRDQIAASAPRSTEHKGTIAILEIRNGQFNILDEAVVQGNEIDGYFGHDFAPIKVTLDSFDSLVVGCPLCNREKGRIYFFENMQGVMFSNGVEIDSPIESQGRFGMTVENIGDIDLDGYEDVAIGAPYADDQRGAVVIYRGTYKGLFKDHSQIIRPSTNTKFHFGFSIYGAGYDLDDNGFPDFTVSGVGFEANAPIFTYHTSPKVNVDMKLNIPEEINLAENVKTECIQVDSSGKSIYRACFDVEACLTYDVLLGKVKNIAIFSLRWKFIVDANSGGSPRVLVNPQYPSSGNVKEGNVTLNRRQETCIKERFYARPDVTQLSENMKVQLLIEDASEPDALPGSGSRLLHPVLNVSSEADHAVLEMTKEISVLNLCGNDNVCTPVYSLDVEGPSRSEELFINPRYFFTFTVTVKNQGVDAGLAPQVRITAQKGLQRANENSISTGALPEISCPFTTAESLLCKLKSPIQPNNEDVVKFNITFSTDAQLALDTERLWIHFAVVDSSGMIQPNTERNMTLQFAAVAEYNLRISPANGDSLRARDVYNTENSLFPFNSSFPLENIGPDANIHFYVANSFDSNKGSEIASSLLTIYWPTKFKTTDITNSSQIQDILLLPTGLITDDSIECLFYGENPLSEDDDRQKISIYKEAGSGPPVDPKLCSEQVECEIMQCHILNLSPGPAKTITVQAVLWSYSITRNFDLSLWATIINEGNEPTTPRKTEMYTIKINAAVQEFAIQCANEFVPIIAVFIGFSGFFIILLLLAFFGFFGQTAMRKKYLEKQAEARRIHVQVTGTGTGTIKVKEDDYYYEVDEQTPPSPAELDDKDVTKSKVVSPAAMQIDARDNREKTLESVENEPIIVPLSRVSISPHREETEI